ncbi:hypothetical protein GCM10019016_137920 [Streptomyces prasinosporus]|uniref:Uncharacterized protein n=1 Tax=Streptomyces prasinosporus TaxID=68256 RepID=A0ABP6UFX6_9ACTN|nr:hypothetical protein GCM10010332_45520 [Streptomyces albogriseolus]
MGVVAVARREKGMSAPSVGSGSAVPNVTRFAGSFSPERSGGAGVRRYAGSPRSSPRP